ncbi:MAG: carboxypeptidase regulatory-like domain-containing protein [Myxococcales bacterium]|nr:carboxypeptidase regulatory-like domain-containing protein [Myxococcales bacterium]
MRDPRLAFAILSFAVIGCGGSGPGGKSVCDNVVPPPAACMTMCDPTPGAPTTCPGGYHCTEDGRCDALCTQSGGECGDGYRCTPDGQCVGNDECVGLECKIVQCDKKGMPPTSISGVVYAPNGTLPLFGINVYIPNTPVAPPPDGAICDRCGDTLPGYPVAHIQTDEAGRFVLTDVPSGANVPLIIQSGKWRRTITIPMVGECMDTALPATETRLPKNKTEGSMPSIAITTGGADALECLPRKLGIEDSEIGKMGDAAKIHLYAGNGRSAFQSGFAGGQGMIPSATPFWDDVNNLKAYDIVILSCEGEQAPRTKPQTSLNAMKAYADLGGRVFASHWHNIWIGGDFNGEAGGMGQTPPVWNSIAQWEANTNLNNAIDTIDEVSNPKGASFATWMLNVMGSTTRGEIPVTQPRLTASSVDAAKAERWVYLDQQGTEFPQIFQFTTPNEAPAGDRCGKVVFSDMHVSADSVSNNPFPQSCSAMPLTPQEKALAFMFFDIASCVQPPIL